MKQIKNMSQAELAAYVQSYLQKAGIDVVLSGGVLFRFTAVINMFQKTLILSTLILQRDKRSGLLWKGLASKKKGATL